MTQEPKPKPREEEIVVLPPDYALKRKIGNLAATQLFGEEVLEKAQQTVYKQKGEFLEWVDQDMLSLQQCYEAIAADLEKAAAPLKKLRNIAFLLKSRSGIFGYDLGSQLARSLYVFCDSFRYRPEEIVVLRKHIDALQLIFRDHITGRGDAVGEELLLEMERLCARFKS